MKVPTQKFKEPGTRYPVTQDEIYLDNALEEDASACESTETSKKSKSGKSKIKKKMNEKYETETGSENEYSPIDEVELSEDEEENNLSEYKIKKRKDGTLNWSKQKMNLTTTIHKIKE